MRTRGCSRWAGQSITSRTLGETVVGSSLSNDGITWDAPVALADAGWVSALGPSYGATYTLVPLSKAYIRFGVTTNQKAGTDLEQVRLVYTLTLAPR
jgi:hypothetical protein